MTVKRMTAKGLVQLRCVDRNCGSVTVILKNTSGINKTDKAFWAIENFQVQRISNASTHSCASIDAAKVEATAHFRKFIRAAEARGVTTYQEVKVQSQVRETLLNTVPVLLDG